MRSRLRDFPVADDEYPVGNHRRGEPVSDEKRRFPLRHHGELAVQPGFRDRVKLGRRLVQKQDRFVSHEGAGERDPLPFAAGDIDASRKVPAQQGIVAVRKIPDKAVRFPFERGGLDFPVVGKVVDIADADVFPDGNTVTEEILKNRSENFCPLA